jgi:hypothetical protein
LDLSETEFNQTLKRLENHDLLERWPEDKLRFQVKGPFLVRREGEMMKKIFPKLRDHLYQHFRQKFPPLTMMNDPGAISLMRSFEFYLSEKSLQRYVRECQELIAKFAQIGIAEAEQKESITAVSCLFGIDKYEGWVNSIRK